MRLPQTPGLVRVGGGLTPSPPTRTRGSGGPHPPALPHTASSIASPEEVSQTPGFASSCRTVTTPSSTRAAKRRDRFTKPTAGLVMSRPSADDEVAEGSPSMVIPAAVAPVASPQAFITKGSLPARQTISSTPLASKPRLGADEGRHVRGRAGAGVGARQAEQHHLAAREEVGPSRTGSTPVVAHPQERALGKPVAHLDRHAVTPVAVAPVTWADSVRAVKERGVGA